MSTYDLETTARSYRELQAEIKALEGQADALKQQMIREMDARQAEELKAGTFTIRYSLYESSRLDMAKLKTDYAELYQEYTKKVASTRFMVA